LFDRPTTPSISPLSLHDALPIFNPRVSLDDRLHGHAPVNSTARLAEIRGTATAHRRTLRWASHRRAARSHRRTAHRRTAAGGHRDRKSTRLNSSHVAISYAVFCL